MRRGVASGIDGDLQPEIIRLTFLSDRYPRHWPIRPIFCRPSHIEYWRTGPVESLVKERFQVGFGRRGGHERCPQVCQGHLASPMASDQLA